MIVGQPAGSVGTVTGSARRGHEARRPVRVGIVPAHSLSMSSLRLLLCTLVFSFSALLPRTGFAAEPLTEAQENGFKELESEFTRLENFLNTLPPSQPRDETRRVLGVMRERAAGLRTNFDATRFDEIKWEVNFEHQQMLLWLQDPRLLPLPADGSARPVNELTPVEKSSGWELLFDGRSLQGWRGYRAKAGPVTNWQVKDGALVPAGKAATGVDLVTERRFSNFELMWEWRSAPGSNGGVKYLVSEDRPSAPGHEYQILDDAGEPNRERRTELQHTGAFYDVLAAATGKALRPVGKWNQSRILVSGQRVEHWLNGVKVLTYELGSPAVKEGIARSKFKAEPGFGQKVTGPILLTYHPTETAYRSIKIRELK